MKTKRKLLTTIMLFFSLTICAQLHIGVFGEANKNFRIYDKGYYNHYPSFVELEDEGFMETVGGGGYVSLRYDMNSFFAIRADCEYQISRYMDNFTYISSSTIGSICDITTNKSSIVIPVMGCAYLQLGKWQLYESIGLYGSYNDYQMESMKDFDFGFANCAGIGYSVGKKMSINAEAKYYRGFVNSHNTGSKYFKQPIYTNIFEIAVGATYSIE